VAPGHARATAAAAIGIALFGWCLTRVATDGLPVEWWIFVALTFVSGRITLVVPGVEATFTVSEVFAFTSVLLFGPEAGAVTLALDCLVLAWHRRMGPDKAAFNFGNLTLAAWASGTLFFAASGAKPLLHGGQPGERHCRGRQRRRRGSPALRQRLAPWVRVNGPVDCPVIERSIRATGLLLQAG
jgi:hypothetical protein